MIYIPNVSASDLFPGSDPLVAGLIAREPAALQAFYDEYAQRLYSYSITMLRDGDRAADVVHDTILLAYERVSQLRDPQHFQAWVYAICRNECLREHRRRKHSDLNAIPEPAAADANFDEGVSAEEARELVTGALAGMSDGDREILELALRHDLDPAQVGQVLGISSDNARARLSRCRVALEGAVGALMLFRGRMSGCPQLRQLSTGQEFTPLLRKRIGRHAQSCPRCAASRRHAISAVAMVSLPLIAIPVWLRDRTVVTEPVAAQFVTDAQSIKFDSGGWPYLASAHKVPLAVAAGVAAILAVAGIAWFGLGPGQQPETHQAAVVEAPVFSQTPAPVEVVPSATSSSPKPTKSRKPTPTATATATPSLTPYAPKTTTESAQSKRPSRTPSSRKPTSKSPTADATSPSPTESATTVTPEPEPETDPCTAPPYDPDVPYTPWVPPDSCY